MYLLNEKISIIQQEEEDQKTTNTGATGKLSRLTIMRSGNKRTLPTRVQNNSVDTLDTLLLDQNSDSSISSRSSSPQSRNNSKVPAGSTIDDLLVGAEEDDDHPLEVIAPRRQGCLKITSQEVSLTVTCKIRADDIDETEDCVHIKMPEPLVKFDVISIHSHCITLGDNPSVSAGPPISIEWKAHDSYTLSLNEYEETKPEPRHRHEMLMPSCVRESMLRDVGYSRSEIVAATKLAQQTKANREKSANDGLYKCILKKGLQSVGSIVMMRKSSSKK